jgi:lipase
MDAAVLHVAAFGEPTGVPVLALHGLGGHGGRWRRLAEQYTGGVRMFCPDLRGHGRSAWVPPWTLEQHAADVLATMDALRLERAAVVGSSFGGVVALYVAHAAPRRVTRLVLLEPAVGMPPEVADARAQAAMNPPVFPNRTAALAHQAALWPQAPTKFVEDEVAEHVWHGADGRWRWRVHPPAQVAAFSQLARPPLVPPPGVPTLLVRASRGSVVDPGYKQLCRARGVELAGTVVDGGHALHLDRPIEIGALLRRFLVD